MPFISNFSSSTSNKEDVIISDSIISISKDTVVLFPKASIAVNVYSPSLYVIPFPNSDPDVAAPLL